MTMRRINFVDNHTEHRTRRKAVCEGDGCGELREIVAHGLCVNCYRRRERQEERERSKDFHSPGLRREQKRLLAAHTQLLIALTKVGVSKPDLTRIRRVLDPYLLPIADHVKLVNEPAARKRRDQAVNQRLGLVNRKTNDVHRSPTPQSDAATAAISKGADETVQTP
jgi:hypothetical protein